MVSIYAFPVIFVSKNSPFWCKKYTNLLFKKGTGTLIKRADVRTPWTSLYPPPWLIEWLVVCVRQVRAEALVSVVPMSSSRPVLVWCVLRVLRAQWRRQSTEDAIVRSRIHCRRPSRCRHHLRLQLYAAIHPSDIAINANFGGANVELWWN